MRAYLQTTANISLLPFNYQHQLTGALHKWLGINGYHDSLSLYSFSWLSGSQVQTGGLNFPKGATWFISSYDIEFIKLLIKGIKEDPTLAYGMSISSIVLQETPSFGNRNVFSPASPVFIKRNVGGSDKFFFFNDEDSSKYLTETLSNKLRKIGVEDNSLLVYFDRTQPDRIRTKKISYKGIDLKGSYCPIIIEGQPSSLSFAWDVGLGNSTGIGFGSLK